MTFRNTAILVTAVNNEDSIWRDVLCFLAFSVIISSESLQTIWSVLIMY
jgi:hypothetical protein